MLVCKEGKYRVIFNPDRKAHWNFIPRRSCFFMFPLCGTWIWNGRFPFTWHSIVQLNELWSSLALRYQLLPVRVHYKLYLTLVLTYDEAEVIFLSWSWIYASFVQASTLVMISPPSQSQLMGHMKEETANTCGHEFQMCILGFHTLIRSNTTRCQVNK